MQSTLATRTFYTGAGGRKGRLSWLEESTGLVLARWAACSSFGALDDSAEQWECTANTVHQAGLVRLSNQNQCKLASYVLISLGKDHCHWENPQRMRGDIDVRKFFVYLTSGSYRS